MARDYLPGDKMRRVLVRGPMLCPAPDIACRALVEGSPCRCTMPVGHKGAHRYDPGEGYVVETRGWPARPPVMQTIRPETKRALNGSPAALFNAEWSGHHWRIGELVRR